MDKRPKEPPVCKGYAFLGCKGQPPHIHRAGEETAHVAPRVPRPEPHPSCKSCTRTDPADFYAYQKRGRTYYFTTCRTCFAANKARLREEWRRSPRMAAEITETRLFADVVEMNLYLSSVTVSFTVPASASRPYWGKGPGERITVGGDGVPLDERPEARQTFSLRQQDEAADLQRYEDSTRRRLPAYNTTTECFRGRHPFHTETLCRGYGFLGCFGLPLHVHRKCITHGVEEIEAAPRVTTTRRTA